MTTLHLRLVAICWFIMGIAVLVSAYNDPGHYSCSHISDSTVPIDTTRIKTLYVFVEIAIDQRHLTQTIRLNLPAIRQEFHVQILSNEASSPSIPAGTKIGPAAPLRIEAAPASQKLSSGSTPGEAPKPTRLAIVSTIQFVAAIQQLRDDLSVSSIPYAPSSLSIEASEETTEPSVPISDSTPNASHQPSNGIYEATIPRSKPLSPGEILGCTAPVLLDVDALMCVASKYFHRPPFLSIKLTCNSLAMLGMDVSIWNPL